MPHDFDVNFPSEADDADGDWYDADTPEAPREDRYEEDAVEVLTQFFEQDPRRVFYLRQVQVIHEKPFFHWVTARAVNRLLAAGSIVADRREIARGNRIELLWHRSHRYPRRQGDAVINLVEKYSDPELTKAVGWQGEALALDALARHQFIIQGRGTRTYGGATWTATDHDFDLVCSRDDHAYGVEVKNKLQYMDWSEIELKIAMARFLGLTPLFVVRWLPKDWVERIRRAGGFSLLFQYQLYPIGANALARRIREELSLPVDAPTSLQEGTSRRFVRWHEERPRL